MPRATFPLFPVQAPSWQPTAPKQHRHNKVGLQPAFQVERTDRCSHQALTSEVHLLPYANPALAVSWEQQWFQRAQGPLSRQQLRTMTQLPNLGRQLSRKLRRTRLCHHLSFPYKKALWATNLGVATSICYCVLCASNDTTSILEFHGSKSSRSQGSQMILRYKVMGKMATGKQKSLQPHPPSPPPLFFPNLLA